MDKYRDQYLMLVQEKIIDEIITGDCKDVLLKAHSNSIQLTITSPPYGNAIDYGIHLSGNGEYYRGRSKLGTSDYLNEMTEIFNDRVYQITRDGGYFCIVIGNEVSNGTILPLPHMLLSKLVQPM